MAPELLLYPEHYAEKGCGPAVDVWALGIIAFFLLSGKVGAHMRACMHVPAAMGCISVCAWLVGEMPTDQSRTAQGLVKDA